MEQSGRPDLLQLIGPDWDRDTRAGATRTLVICSAPRTGSYELCRFLAAAGIGVPHEYFHPYFAERLKERWGLTEDALSPAGLSSYIDTLRQRRTAGGVLSIKLQYWQFEASLRNQHGVALFDGALFLHLFRPDITDQLLSYRAARRSGRWDHTEQRSSQPKTAIDENTLEAVACHIEALVEEDAGFRRLFASLGVNPLFVTMQELFADPSLVVHTLAGVLGMTVDETALANMIHLSAPYSYPTSPADDAVGRLTEKIKRQAFKL